MDDVCSAAALLYIHMELDGRHGKQTSIQYFTSYYCFIEHTKMTNGYKYAKTGNQHFIDISS